MTDSDSDDKGPLDQVLDVLVFLPIGFALELRNSIPTFIERGRREVEHLTSFSGSTVTRTSDANIARLPGGRQIERHIDRWQEQTKGTLRALGVIHGGNGSGDTETQRRPSAVSEDVGAAESDATVTQAAASERRSTSGIDPETLAIPDFDSLSASQVIRRLESLQRDELESIRQYEAGSRGRMTILNKIAQLQTQTS